MIATTTCSIDNLSIARQPAPQLARLPHEPTFTILLAEHRDEVFARLAYDVREMGHRVFRTTRGDVVSELYHYSLADLVICNCDLPDASGWLTATKLRMYDASARVWLYAPRKSALQRSWAELSGIERVFYYQGDLLRLSDHITDGLWRFDESHPPRTSNRVRRTQSDLKLWEKPL